MAQKWAPKRVHRKRAVSGGMWNPCGFLVQCVQIAVVCLCARLHFCGSCQARTSNTHSLCLVSCRLFSATCSTELRQVWYTTSGNPNLRMTFPPPPMGRQLARIHNCHLNALRAHCNAHCAQQHALHSFVVNSSLKRTLKWRTFLSLSLTKMLFFPERQHSISSSRACYKKKKKKKSKKTTN